MSDRIECARCRIAQLQGEAGRVPHWSEINGV